ncbi:hypothetical protein [Novosphingobium sp. Chol11]|uniref:hypothetical protein n=1 Tax=Novosphingobium sp. Chol11 TaxID=1385763 RepID=UPI002600FC5B|nr:hypothetical protein [Novosphingobium sp. Chol11]
MGRRDRLLLAGVISTMLAWGSWSAMDQPGMVPWSTTENILNAAGYAFCALALFFLFAGMRLPK